MMSGSYEKLKESRQEMVEKFLTMMQQGTLNWTKGWNSSGLLPYNPVSDCRYQKGNRLRLFLAAMENHYQDPRWMTFKQAQEAGLQIKKGSKGVRCEKWIFEKEQKVENEEGETIKEKVQLNSPIVSFFVLFNGEQIEGMPPLPDCDQQRSQSPEAKELADRLISISECPVVEVAQPSACYQPGSDRILLPPRKFFNSIDEFNATLLHEMGHSTGHPDRLNRKIENDFGTPEYAKEELRAELASAFGGLALGIQANAVDENHAAYLQSWMSVLRADPDELFRAAADADAITERIIGRYRERYPDLHLGQMQHIETKSYHNIETPEQQKQQKVHRRRKI